MSLVKNTLYRAANMVLKPEGQFHNRLSDLLTIIVRGWDTGQSHAEISERCWQAIKNDAPKLRDKLVFVIQGLEAGWGGGDFLAWMKQGGDWDDLPKSLPSTRPSEHAGGGGSKALPGSAEAGREDREAPQGGGSSKTVTLRLEETLQCSPAGSGGEGP